MMKLTMKYATMTEETVAYILIIMIIALFAIAILKNFVVLDFILQLEMVCAMMKQTLLPVIMMVEIAVDPASIKITALTVHALEMSLAMEFLMHLLEMGFATIK